MAIKADFTEDEWQALEKGVIGAGMFVSVSEPDFTHTISETNALVSYLTGQRGTSGSELVRELANARVNPLAFNAPSRRIEDEALAALRSAAATLAAKAPDDVAAYRTSSSVPPTTSLRIGVASGLTRRKRSARSAGRSDFSEGQAAN
jgi:hypothetical protein